MTFRASHRRCPGRNKIQLKVLVARCQSKGGLPSLVSDVVLWRDYPEGDGEVVSQSVKRQMLAELLATTNPQLQERRL